MTVSTPTRWSARLSIGVLAIALAAPPLLSVMASAPERGAGPRETQPADPPPFEDVHPRSGDEVTLLQINDVYSARPIDGAGGLARVATIRRALVDQGRTPLLLLAGDFLSSSAASAASKGAQMLAVLNAVPVDVATLGNHEFDFGVDVLLTRMAEAQWQWVVANVVDRRTGKPVGGAAPYVVRTVGSLRVGILGLSLTEGLHRRGRLAQLEFIDPLQAAAAYLPALNAEADVVVALTHLSYADDRALAERFPDIDVVVGGHDHDPIASTVGQTLISKAGSDAQYVARIDLHPRPNGGVERVYELLPVTSVIPDDPETVRVIDAWEARLGPQLDRTIGQSRVALDGVESHVRSRETNLGNLVADAIRADVDAEIAIVHGGGIRGDRLYPRGRMPRRVLLEMHPFGGVVCKLSVPGRVVLAALNNGVSRLPASAGRFPQVSGMTVQIEEAAAPGDRVRGVMIGGAPIDPTQMYSLAVPDYLVDGGDGYTMLSDQEVLVSPAQGLDIVEVLARYIGDRREVAPMVEGRVSRTKD